MYLILFFLLLAVIFIVLLLEEPLTVTFLIDTDNEDARVLIKWLDPFFNARVKMVNYRPFLSIYIFKLKVYSKAVKSRKKQGKSKGKGISIIRSLYLQDSYANMYYNLGDPFLTAVTDGALLISGTYLSKMEINQIPDFYPDHAYIYFEGGTEIDLVKSWIRYNHAKENQKVKRREEYGSVQFSR
ncbi:MAG: hypothetical protein Q8865_00205 [Bacillota bacterium]|nr:hypothetical protein [Bacillota bacterium]